MNMAAARGFLIDLDGTLVAGGSALPGAATFLSRLHGRFALVSNDAEHTPTQLTVRLRRMGLAVPSDRIVLAGVVSLDLIARERPNARILLLGSPALQRYARQQGLQLADGIKGPKADTVLLCRDRHVTYKKLSAAVSAIRSGATLMVANPDLVHPGINGHVVLETGALLQTILAGTGPVAYRVIGKPEPELFLAGLAILGTQPSETIMVGDNPVTDGAGAERLGMKFLMAEPTGPAAWVHQTSHSYS